MWGRRKGIFSRRKFVSDSMKGDKYDGWMRNRKKVSLGNVRVHDGLQLGKSLEKELGDESQGPTNMLLATVVY